MPARTRPQVDISAQCACGAIGMAVRGPVYAMFMCSCEDCQKATGTGHSTVAIVNPADVVLTGSPTSFSRQADSGATFTRWFCATCGTPLHGKSSRAPDTTIVPVGFFAGQTEWFAPNQLIFARSRRGWDVFADHLPRHETYRHKGDL